MKKSRIVWLAAIFVLMGAAGLGYYRWRVVQSRDKHLAALQSNVRAWGAHVIPEDNRDRALAPLKPVLGRDLTNKIGGSPGNHATTTNVDATKEQLAELLDGQPFSRVTLGGCKNLDDDWIAGIRDPSSMIQLSIGGTKVSDRSAEAILAMQRLRALELVDTEVSDQSVDRLRGLPALGEFYVGGPNIRAVHLAETAVLDESGRPATQTGRPVRIQGRVTFESPPVSPRKVRVLVRVPGEWPAWRTIPYGWSTRLATSGVLVQDSPGAWRFQVVVDKIPQGRSSVEVWVDGPAADRKFVFYRMTPFPLDLAPDESAR